MSARDAYDIDIQHIQSVDAHRSIKNRDAEIEIIDGVHDTRVQSGIEKAKEEYLKPY